jgi:hypothetical protein
MLWLQTIFIKTKSLSSFRQRSEPIDKRVAGEIGKKLRNVYSVAIDRVHQRKCGFDNPIQLASFQL